MYYDLDLDMLELSPFNEGWKAWEAGKARNPYSDDDADGCAQWQEGYYAADSYYKKDSEFAYGSGFH